MNATVSPAVRLKIQGMDCGSCALTIEQAVRTVPGITTVRVDFTTETLEATGSASSERIVERVKSLGYQIADESTPKQAPRPELRGLAGFLRFLAAERRTQIAIAVSILVIAAALLGNAFGPNLVEAALLATVVVVGAPILLKGLRSLFVARHVMIDLLMGIATVGAVAIGETGEAAAVVLLFTLGEALEAYSAERSRDALRSLLSLQPDEATVLEAHTESHAAPADHGHDDHKHGAACAHDDHGHGQEHAAPKPVAAALHFHQRRQPTASVPVGAHILVKPGERVPSTGESWRAVPASIRLQ